MDWQEEYKRRLVSPEDAVEVVKSGDVVYIPLVGQPKELLAALAARRDDLQGVTIVTTAPESDPGWWQPGWEESFQMTVFGFAGPLARPCLDQRRADFSCGCISTEMKAATERGMAPNVMLARVTPPNNHGFVCFGADAWGKKSTAKRAKKVIASVDETVIRTFGDNWIHVSEIDRFVEHHPILLSEEQVMQIISCQEPESRREKLWYIVKNMPAEFLPEVLPLLIAIDDAGLDFVPKVFGIAPPDKPSRAIAYYLETLIRDGDTIQVGVATPSGWMPQLGVFDNKHDLGYHSEMAARGIARLVDGGVITGKHKTIHNGVAVAGAWTGCDPDEMQIINDNPNFEIQDSEYVINISTISKHNKMVAINNAVSVDLTGQINSETVFGGRIINGPGGQPESHIGAVLSKGGRGITLLRSTALNGAVSTITAQHEAGSIITVPRYFADYVITEYGIASLMGKTQRQRADELISVAHPSFRAELKQEAQKLFYP